MEELSREGLTQLIFAQFEAVQDQYPGLELKLGLNGTYLLEGEVAFDLQIGDQRVCGQYKIAICVPSSYPATPPTATEIGGDIPSTFHRFRHSNELCLAAPVEVFRLFRRTPTLYGFITNLVLPYLINYHCFANCGSLPFGELKHGAEGLLDYYEERFGTKLLPTLKLLRYLANEMPAAPIDCPCDSGKRFRDCHQNTLVELSECFSRNQFKTELDQIWGFCVDAELVDRTTEIRYVENLRSRKRKLERILRRIKNER